MITWEEISQNSFKIKNLIGSAYKGCQRPFRVRGDRRKENLILVTPVYLETQAKAKQNLGEHTLGDAEPRGLLSQVTTCVDVSGAPPHPQGQAGCGVGQRRGWGVNLFIAL